MERRAARSATLDYSLPIEYNPLKSALNHIKSLKTRLLLMMFCVVTTGTTMTIAYWQQTGVVLSVIVPCLGMLGMMVNFYVRIVRLEWLAQAHTDTIQKLVGVPEILVELKLGLKDLNQRLDRERG